MTHGPGPIIEVLLGVTAEVLEGDLVRIEERAERFIQTRHVEAPTRIAQRQDEDVPDDRLRPEPDTRLAPVNLTLLPGRGFKSCPGQIGPARRLAQGPNKPPHRRVTARILPLLSQLLIQNLCRVVHSRCPLA